MYLTPEQKKLITQMYSDDTFFCKCLPLGYSDTLSKFYNAMRGTQVIEYDDELGIRLNKIRQKWIVYKKYGWENARAQPM